MSDGAGEWHQHRSTPSLIIEKERLCVCEGESLGVEKLGMERTTNNDIYHNYAMLVIRDGARGNMLKRTGREVEKVRQTLR